VGLAQLVARLEHEADARIASIEERARAELEGIAQQRERASSAAREQDLAVRRAARRTRLEGELAQARSQARDATLSARRAFVDRVLGRAATMLDGAERDETYLSALAGQTAEVMRFVDDRPVSVRCRPALATRLSRAPGTLAAALEPDPQCPVGVILTARDGSVQIDDTLSARLQRLRGQLGPELLAEVER